MGRQPKRSSPPPAPSLGPSPRTAPPGRGAQIRAYARQLLERLEELRVKIRKKGRERLTIMVIPHTERQILNFHLSVFTISGVIGAVALVMLISVISLVGKSGEDLTHYGMGLDNKQFKLQSLKMAEEMLPLHEIVNRYANTISELHIKVDGQSGEDEGRGGMSQAVIDGELEELQKLIQRCQSNKDACDQDLTKEMLRRVIFLSKQDNESLRRSIELSDKILAELRTREKQNLLKHTPSIWPTRGYLLSPYGRQTDAVLGKAMFKRGIEIGAAAGTEVYATAPGEVRNVFFDENYGIVVVIEHRYGMRTHYAHLDSVRIARGEKIEKGQVIGFVGRTGNAAVDMLYYEVHVGTVAYNPHSFLNHLQDQWLITPKP